MSETLFLREKDTVEGRVTIGNFQLALPIDESVSCDLARNIYSIIRTKSTHADFLCDETPVCKQGKGARRREEKQEEKKK